MQESDQSLGLSCRNPIYIYKRGCKEVAKINNSKEKSFWFTGVPGRIFAGWWKLSKLHEGVFPRSFGVARTYHAIMDDIMPDSTAAILFQIPTLDRADGQLARHSAAHGRLSFAT